MEKHDGEVNERTVEENLIIIQQLADRLCESTINCPICGKTFTRKDNMIRHRKRMHSQDEPRPSTSANVESNNSYQPQSNESDLESHIPKINRLCKSRLNCSICGAGFTRMDNMVRHSKLIHNQDEPSPSTSTDMNRNNSYQSKSSHIQDESSPSTSMNVESNDSHHPKSSHIQDKPCNWCGKVLRLLPGKRYCEACGRQGIECEWCHRPLPLKSFTLSHRICDACQRKTQKKIGRGVRKETALNGRVQNHIIKPNEDNKRDLLYFFKENERHVSDILYQQLNKGFKFFIVISVRLIRYTAEGDEIVAYPTFRSANTITVNVGRVEESLADAFHKIHKSFETYQKESSGWLLDEIVKMEVNIVDYNPVHGSSYIPTPDILSKKKAIINVQNSDEYCFVWSVLAALYPTEHNAVRIQHYTSHFNTLNLNGLKFPLTLDQISKFETLNKISITVLGYEGEVFPLHVTDRRYDKHVTLLLISAGSVRHYCLVTSLSRLLGDRTRSHCKSYYCHYCLHGFYTEKTLEEHVPICTPFGAQKTEMPQDKILKFKNVHSQLKVPFVIFADFEAYTRKMNESSEKTVRYEKHEASGFCYLVVSTEAKYSRPPVVYRGPKVVDTFLQELLKENDRICSILENVEPMAITAEQQKAFDMATHCHICDGELNQNDKARDHEHLSGRFRGAACNRCNLQYRFRRSNIRKNRNFFIPIILHNCRSYDSHLIAEGLGKFKDTPISCIANNLQKYISFSLGNLRFIDSLQFLNTSLEALVNNLAKDCPEAFHHLKSHFPDDTLRSLLLRKGVYPYSYVSDESKLADTKLPPIEAFYNELKEEHLTSDDYAHAQMVWSQFGISNLGEYHDLYLTSDVLLLADVFENFRNICLSFYKLDPAHYFTSPGLSWDAMLKMTGVQLELLQDINMHLFVENGMRGGTAMISTKFSKANNPYLSDYDPSHPTSYIVYLDANNLYGWAMSQFLPIGDFEWLTEEQLHTLDVSLIPDDAETGFILEVSLNYPDHLHENHSDYPLCPERLIVTDDMLSDYSSELKQRLDLKGRAVEKLVPNLYHKQNYVLHYRNLKFYLTQGMVLTKVHRGIKFTQSPWLKPYIDFNTERRKEAQNDFEKSFFKLLNNAVYGKTMENLRKRTNIELVHTEKRLEKLVAKPSFQATRIFNPDLVGVHMKNSKLILNRPVYAGFTILDVSKLLMYDFHYNHIRSKYGDKAKLLFTDTDSLCYEIQCPDLYQDIKSDSHLFDTSNYPKEHLLYSTDNAKVLGKFKDEAEGFIIEEFVGLRAKMYSFVYNGQEKQTAKGISKYVIKKKLRHSMYKDSLFQKRQYTSSMNCIRSYDHQLHTIRLTKVGLSPFDDKRYVLRNGFDTLAHGHFKTTQSTLI